jgi:stage III sporulation protein AH
MNRKQAFIIATLLVLIVCAGILATKVNNPLYTDANELTQTSSNASKGDFFTESKLTRDNKYIQDVPTYQAMMNDPETTKTAKDALALKLKQMTEKNGNEKAIETQLKGKGFEDSFCQILDEKVSVYVKADKLTEQQAKDIKNLVVGITKVKQADVEISSKQ